MVYPILMAVSHAHWVAIEIKPSNAIIRQHTYARATDVKSMRKPMIKCMARPVAYEFFIFFTDQFITMTSWR